uniref:Secretogranin II n=1 Tax=Electrophorus electricus TaxID=8005 RepID=A0AAY5EJ62_ELEEL
MPPLAWFCSTGLFLLSPLSLLSTLLCLHVGVHGATLWEPHQQDGSPDPPRPAFQAPPPPPPSAAMLRALEHIQRLSQQAAHGSDAGSVNAGEDPGDMERVRAMLQQVTPARPAAGMHSLRGEKDKSSGQEEHEVDEGQKWIEEVLSRLLWASKPVTPQEAAHAARSHSVTPRATTHSLFSLSPPPGPTQEHNRQANAMGIRRHDRKFPLLFEDKEGQEQPLKRTNENAEEQYTPQKMATLQSVFEELSRIANSKAYNKRQNGEDDESGNTNEDYDWYREKKLAFEDGNGEEELTPLEEQTELEEEETRRRQFREADDEVKRSNQSDLLQMEKEEEPDDVSKLVDYYLFKVLEKTEQEKQKREEEDEQRDKERRAAQLWYRGDSQPLYQLLKISQKLKIPPEDIVDLLESEENKNPDRLWQRRQGQSRTPSLRYPRPLGPHKDPAGVLYRRPPKTQEMSTITQDILRILGLASMAQPGNKSFLRPNQYKLTPALRYSLVEREIPDYVLSESGRDQPRADHDDAEHEDGLASYLVAELLAQRQRRASPELEQAVRDFLDDPGMSVSEKRQVEQEKTTEDSDEDTLFPPVSTHERVATGFHRN